jgi:RNA polymerase sigma factor (sigma-70 family)
LSVLCGKYIFNNSLLHIWVLLINIILLTEFLINLVAQLYLIALQKKIYIEDSTLWNSLRLGDETAFEELYHRYFQVLFSYGKRLLNDEDIVKDAIQDLFIDIWRTHKNLNQAQSVKFYLISSLRRKIHRSLKPDYLLRDDWENVNEHLLPISQSVEIDFTQIEDEYLNKEKVTAWLLQLPERQNEALVLRYFHNFEYSEIAQILDIKEQTARNLVQKAIILLRKMAISLIITLLSFFL